mmetsp:Transcript_10584/g.24875  ORF Transcript_10584/g.24875 Transcript_10584/m.24875 type:complete len:187 (+) Transcript_10584:2-562(+)
MGFPSGVFDQLSLEGAVVDLTCTEISCVPPAPTNTPTTLEEANSPFTRVTYLLPDGLDPLDECRWITSCTRRGYNGCDFYVNREGMLSRGGECWRKCQEVDLRGKGVKNLPHMPRTAFGGMDILRIIHLDEETEIRPSRQFAITDIMWHKLTLHRPNGTMSWIFVGKAWFQQQLPNVWTISDDFAM